MEKVIQLLEESKWYPEHPTAHEIQVVYHLNRIIDSIIWQLKQQEKNEKQDT